MRTNIEIDDKLMARAMRVSKQTTKRATVEAALQALVRLNDQRRILRSAGKVLIEDVEHSDAATLDSRC